ncbi:hypothetical protein PR202_gb17913 [Eleusine coracana subsp. coracana]|uniref:Uncharacterized protein n=1 Tax=Eleusine coracana subsp. coracana TaxID=191504 RepID=A0AAV5F1Y0_ELECO|nr:hypothetical protein PR202_gb17913 [Eleusine coracana subsp. coracana]
MGERLQTHPISTYVVVFSLLWASIVVEKGPCLVAGYDADLCDDGVVLARAAVAIRAAIQAQQQEEVDQWVHCSRVVPKEMFTVTASSNRFMAYETVFGLGKPSRVELVSLFAGELVMLLGAVDGGVQLTASITVRPSATYACTEQRHNPPLKPARRRFATDPSMSA